MRKCVEIPVQICYNTNKTVESAYVLFMLQFKLNAII